MVTPPKLQSYPNGMAKVGHFGALTHQADYSPVAQALDFPWNAMRFRADFCSHLAGKAQNLSNRKGTERV